MAIISLLAWVQIPAPIPFTMQTLGIYLACGVLGGKTALLTAMVYIALGMVGLPVFSGFSGGFGALLGPTGGFIMGFVLIPLSVLLAEKTPIKKHSLVIGCGLGTAFCYIAGMLWYSLVYMRGEAGLIAAFFACVLPYIIPDGIKLMVAAIAAKRINKTIK